MPGHPGATAEYASVTFCSASLLQRLENGLVLAEPLLVPEVSWLGRDESEVTEALQERVSSLLSRWGVHEQISRMAPPDLDGMEFTIEVPPPAGQVAWVTPVGLRFRAVRWHVGERAWAAFVPALGVAVVGTGLEEMPGCLEQGVREELARRVAALSLEELARWQRAVSLEVSPWCLEGEAPPPERGPVPLVVLPEVATELTEDTAWVGYELDDEVQRLARLLGGHRRASVLLVGPAGAGKTALVHELVRQRASAGMGATAFWETSGARLVAGQSDLGAWEERGRLLCGELARSGSILVAGNVVELIEAGRAGGRAAGAAALLRLPMARGEVAVVAECTAEQLALVERDHPDLLVAFQVMRVESPSPFACRRILARAAAGTTSLDDAALERIESLHRRHAVSSAWPGRPLRFLRHLLAEGGPVDSAVVARAFSRETGLPLFLLDDQAGLDLVATRRFFSSRVQGQDEAVERILDLVATMKAGLSRPGRPLASLLFVGPTGVGKTETARALAEFLFSDRGRLVRFDMGEHAEPEAVARLVGGGGDLGDEGLLTSALREQPFCVLLLDEVEKAHASFLDLLLQALDCGRLADARGRVADLCNAVVIMTSNLGAEGFHQAPLGFVTDRDTREHARRHFLHAVESALRPELVNRIDGVVPFAPLDAACVALLARREIAAVAERDGIARRGVRLVVDEEVERHLAQEGWDRRFGARHLKRAVERLLLAPLASALNSFPWSAALEARVRMEEGRIRVEVARRRGLEPRPGGEDAMESLAACCRDLRLSLGRLQAGPGVRHLTCEMERLERRLASLRQRGREGEGGTVARRLSRWRLLREDLADLEARAVAVEEESLLECLGRGTAEHGAGRGEMGDLAARRDRLVLALFEMRFEVPDQVSLAVAGGPVARCLALGRAYLDLMRACGGEVELAAVRRPGRGGERVPLLEPLADVECLGAEGSGDLLGLALECRGPLAWPRFSREGGIHAFVDPAEEGRGVVERCRVTVANGPLASLALRAPRPRDEEPRPLRRRTYDAAARHVDDAFLGHKVAWTARSLREALAEAVQGSLELALQQDVWGGRP